MSAQTLHQTHKAMVLAARNCGCWPIAGTLEEYVIAAQRAEDEVNRSIETLQRWRRRYDPDPASLELGSGQTNVKHAIAKSLLEQRGRSDPSPDRPGSGVGMMPRPAVPRYPANHRPAPTADVAYGVPALQLVAMVRAEAAFNAVAMAEAWEFEPPTSIPVPYVEIPREVAIVRVGGWSRHLDAKQAAKHVPRTRLRRAQSVPGELNASPKYMDSPPEIASAIHVAKSMLYRKSGNMPQRNPWGKRHLTPGKTQFR